MSFSKFASILSLFALAGCVGSNKGEPQQRTVAQSQPNYCIALRGNGELQPAHWGALAQTIEKFGIPSAMSGGSSATISMFLVESMAFNPAVEAQSESVQKTSYAFMLKSLVGFFSELRQTPLYSDVEKLVGTAKDFSKSTALEDLQKAVAAGQFQTAMKIYNDAVSSAVVDPETTDALKRAVLERDLPRATFLISELRETARVFGKFNAETDDNLFFRPGIVNFEKAAELFGRISGFYSAEGSRPLAEAWSELLKTCSADSEGKLWQEIVTKNPECSTQFQAMFKSYFMSNASNFKAEDRIIGRRFEVYPSTSVLVDSAVTDFKRAKANYRSSMDAHFGKNFKISNPEDVRFGYWGKTDRLRAIQSKLDPSDEKARRFFPLGPATWKQVLALSPAEPGLSPIKEFRNQAGKVYASAGGWSDLHPVDLLKAAGCSDVVYITRKGVESSFAQGIARRLMGEDTRYKLYDSENVSSSFNRSIRNATSVLCTNWNAYNVKTQAAALIENSYRSPIIDAAKKPAKQIPGCTVN